MVVGGYKMQVVQIGEQEDNSAEFRIDEVLYKVNDITTDLIGYGGQATIYKAVSESGEVVAIKEISQSSRAHLLANNDLKKGVEKQVKTLEELTLRETTRFPRHVSHGQNLAQGNMGNFCIVMEYIDGMTFDELQGRKVKKNELEELLKGGLNVLEELHDLGAVHRDVSPKNILLRRNGSEIKEEDVAGIDLGCVGSLLSGTVTVGSGLTPGYAAPEVFDMKYEPASDIFSLGRVLYGVITGKNMTSVSRLHRGDFAEIREFYGDLMADVLEKMCVHELGERYSSVDEIFSDLYDREVKNKVREKVVEKKRVGKKSFLDNVREYFSRENLTKMFRLSDQVGRLYTVVREKNNGLMRVENRSGELLYGTDRFDVNGFVMNGLDTRVVGVDGNIIESGMKHRGFYDTLILDGRRHVIVSSDNGYIAVDENGTVFGKEVNEIMLLDVDGKKSEERDMDKIERVVYRLENMDWLPVYGTESCFYLMNKDGRMFGGELFRRVLGLENIGGEDCVFGVNEKWEESYVTRDGTVLMKSARINGEVTVNKERWFYVNNEKGYGIARVVDNEVVYFGGVSDSVNRPWLIMEGEKRYVVAKYSKDQIEMFDEDGEEVGCKDYSYKGKKNIDGKSWFFLASKDEKGLARVVDGELKFFGGRVNFQNYVDITSMESNIDVVEDGEGISYVTEKINDGEINLLRFVSEDGLEFVLELDEGKRTFPEVIIHTVERKEFNGETYLGVNLASGKRSYQGRRVYQRDSKLGKRLEQKKACFVEGVDETYSVIHNEGYAEILGREGEHRFEGRQLGKFSWYSSEGGLEVMCFHHDGSDGMNGNVLYGKDGGSLYGTSNQDQDLRFGVGEEVTLVGDKVLRQFTEILEEDEIAGVKRYGQVQLRDQKGREFFGVKGEIYSVDIIDEGKIRVEYRVASSPARQKQEIRVC